MKINCPHCGATIETPKQTLVKCHFCSSSFILEMDDNDFQSLIHLHKLFYIKSKAFTALTMIQHPHDEGIRLDYLVKDSHGDEFILMVEDENIALIQSTQEIINENLTWNSLLPNSQVELLNKQWLVTQKRALNGENKQSYLSNQSAELVILTFANNRISCQQGKWLDAFEISHEN